MDPKKVSDNFIKFCNNYNGGFINEYNISTNGMLEYFGKTFRGNKKIYQQLRYNISAEYTHIFHTAHKCPPFETRSTHYEPRIEPPENYLTLSKPSTSISYESPPQSNISPKLPELTQGRKFLPETACNSFSDDSFVTPNKQNSIKNYNAPVPDNLEQLDNENGNKIDNDLDGIQPLLDNEVDEISVTNSNDNNSTTTSVTTPNRQSFDCKIIQNCKKDDSFDDIKPLPDNEIEGSSITNSNDNCISNQPSTSSDKSQFKHEKLSESDEKLINQCDNSISTSQSIYSEMKYLETFGVLRTIHQTKHRGICYPNRSHASNDVTENPTSLRSSSSSSTSASTFDRKCKIKIAYRLRKTDNEIQYALIIYEHITRNPATRRNLMDDFMTTIKKKHKSVVTEATAKKRKKLIDETKQERMKRFRF